MAIGILIVIAFAIGFFLIRRNNLIVKYVEENSQYYHSVLKMKQELGLSKLGLDYLVKVQDFIDGNRRAFNKYIQGNSKDAVYASIMKRKPSVFASYTQWRKELEAIEELQSDWKAYVSNHESTYWENMLPDASFLIKTSARKLYKVEARLVMNELSIQKPEFKLEFDVQYVTPGGRDTHHWRNVYLNYDFSPIANIWHDSTHQDVVEKPKAQLALPDINHDAEQQKLDNDRLRMDYLNRKHKEQVQARVDKVLSAQKKFEDELNFNNEILKIAENFDELMSKYSQSLIKDLNNAKVAIALTQMKPELELDNFRRRFKKFRHHSLDVRKTFYNKMVTRYPKHQTDIIRFTKQMNADVDKINHDAYAWVESLVKDYSYYSKKDLSFCYAESIAKQIRREFKEKKLRYGLTFNNNQVDSDEPQVQKPLDADVYDAMLQHIDLPDDSDDFVESMPDSIVTFKTPTQNVKVKPQSNVIPMRPVIDETATERWEHEFDAYDFNVRCDFMGVPYKDTTYKNLVESEATRLGTSLAILNRMRFYSLSQYLMLKSSHMLKESIVAEQPMVYIIYNKSKELVYVGQASQGFAKRFEEHLHSYHNNIAHNGSATTGSYLWNLDLLAGDDIYFSFITVYRDSNNPGFRSMDSLENAFIHIFHSNNSEYGYNQKLGNGVLKTAMGQVLAY